MIGILVTVYVIIGLLLFLFVDVSKNSLGDKAKKSFLASKVFYCIILVLIILL